MKSRNISCVEEDQCVGCFACFDKCYKKAITLTTDNHGFRFPNINVDECINCGACKNVCPSIKSPNVKDNEYKEFRIMATKNENVLRNSTSGGMFYEIAASFISQYNGVVYGAAFSSDIKSVIHTRVSNINDLKKLQGSKYIQSQTDGIFAKVESDLKSGNKVLFSGTPCQVHALKMFVGAHCNNLYTIDIICHGVSSPGMWIEHVATLEKKHKLTAYECRSKDRGWHAHTEKAYYENGKSDSKSLLVQKHKYFFDHNYNLRNSCYQCKYTSLSRIGDITIGDCWGVNNVYPEIDNNTGLSLVILNSLKGCELVKKVENNCFLMTTELKEGIRQKPLVTPVEKPKDIATFWNLYEAKGYMACARRYGRYRFSSYIKDFILALDNMLPTSIIGLIKKN